MEILELNSVIYHLPQNYENNPFFKEIYIPHFWFRSESNFQNNE